MNYIMMSLGIIALFIGHLVQNDYNKMGFYGMCIGFEISALILLIASIIK